MKIKKKRKTKKYFDFKIINPITSIKNIVVVTSKIEDLGVPMLQTVLSKGMDINTSSKSKKNELQIILKNTLKKKYNKFIEYKKKFIEVSTDDFGNCINNSNNSNNKYLLHNKKIYPLLHIQYLNKISYDDFDKNNIGILNNDNKIEFIPNYHKILNKYFNILINVIP